MMIRPKLLRMFEFLPKFWHVRPNFLHFWPNFWQNIRPNQCFSAESTYFGRNCRIFGFCRKLRPNFQFRTKLEMLFRSYTPCCQCQEMMGPALLQQDDTLCPLLEGRAPLHAQFFAPAKRTASLTMKEFTVTAVCYRPGPPHSLFLWALISSSLLFMFPPSSVDLNVNKQLTQKCIPLRCFLSTTSPDTILSSSPF